MKKTVNKIFISVFIFIIAILIQNISKAEEITSNYYEIDNEKNIISVIEPETTIETLKSKISNSELDLRNR